jgi:hypothetical protein
VTESCSGVSRPHVLGMEVTSVMVLSTEGRIHFLGIEVRTELWAFVQAACQSMAVIGHGIFRRRESVKINSWKQRGGFFSKFGQGE